MSNMLCQLLEKKGVPSHYVEELNDRETLVKKVQIVPLEVIIRNTAAGSFSKRFGVEEGTKLKNPTLEYCLKDDALGDPMINDTQILAIGAATQEELDQIAAMAYKVNEVLIEFFKTIGIELIDFKIEFGRFHGDILLADEISPDTARFWDSESHEKLDCDFIEYAFKYRVPSGFLYVTKKSVVICVCWSWGWGSLSRRAMPLVSSSCNGYCSCISICYFMSVSYIVNF